MPYYLTPEERKETASETEWAKGDEDIPKPPEEPVYQGEDGGTPVTPPSEEEKKPELKFKDFQDNEFQDVGIDTTVNPGQKIPITFDYRNTWKDDLGDVKFRFRIFIETMGERKRFLQTIGYKEAVLTETYAPNEVGNFELKIVAELMHPTTKTWVEDAKYVTTISTGGQMLKTGLTPFLSSKKARVGGTVLFKVSAKALNSIAEISQGNPVQGLQVNFYANGEKIATETTDRNGEAETQIPVKEAWAGATVSIKGVAPKQEITI